MLHTLPRLDKNATPCLRDNSFAFFLKFAANVTEYIGCRDVVCRTFARDSCPRVNIPIGGALSHNPLPCFNITSGSTFTGYTSVYRNAPTSAHTAADDITIDNNMRLAGNTQ